MDLEKFIEQSAIQHCLGLDRVSRLIAAGHANRHEIEQTAAVAVQRQRGGMNGRMRASDCIDAAESAVRQRYKGIKLPHTITAGEPNNV